MAALRLPDKYQRGEFVRLACGIVADDLEKLRVGIRRGGRAPEHFALEVVCVDEIDRYPELAFKLGADPVRLARVEDGERVVYFRG